MSQEIVDAVREIEREKGIESGTLVAALEDALLAAYKKTPGASLHATVELDDRDDLRVFAIELPEDLEVRLLDEARERAIDDLERIEEETGEKNHTLLSDDDLEIDWTEVPDSEVKRQDVTPENFGRIAAQTAKQVILQRIREAEREMMYDEYIDRVGRGRHRHSPADGATAETSSSISARSRRSCPAPSRSTESATEQGSRIKAVIREVRTGTKGPQVILSRRDPELIKTLFELRWSPDRRRSRDDRGRRPRARVPVEDRRRSRTHRASIPSAPASDRAARASGWWSRSSRGEKIDIIPRLEAQNVAGDQLGQRRAGRRRSRRSASTRRSPPRPRGAPGRSAGR